MEKCPVEGWTWQEAIFAVAPPDLINAFRKAEAELSRIRALPRSRDPFYRVENFGVPGGHPDPAVSHENEINRIWLLMYAHLIAELSAAG